MQWKFIAVGKPTLKFAQDGIAEYLPRLQRYTKAEIDYLKDGPPDILDERFERAAAGCVRILLDERGERWTTRQLKDRVDAWEMAGTKRIALLIGGADGHSPAQRQSATCILSLSPLTLQHELALVVALEQIYRVYTMKRGEPYHR